MVTGRRGVATVGALLVRRYCWAMLRATDIRRCRRVISVSYVLATPSSGELMTRHVRAAKLILNCNLCERRGNRFNQLFKSLAGTQLKRYCRKKRKEISQSYYN